MGMNYRMERAWANASMLRKIASAAVLIAVSAVSVAQDVSPRTLFTNVHVFDGVSDKRIENANVLVEGNLIKEISTTSINAGDATVINGGGRTLMPGIIDPHVHIISGGSTVADILYGDPSYAIIQGVKQAELMLSLGVTTVRDLAGPVFGIKKAVDKGLIPGPRIYPSGAMISQTSGHLDYGCSSWRRIASRPRLRCED